MLINSIIGFIKRFKKILKNQYDFSRRGFEIEIFINICKKNNMLNKLNISETTDTIFMIKLM